MTTAEPGPAVRLGPPAELATAPATTERGTVPSWFGRVVAPAVEPALPFDAVIPSWNARTPDGTWIQLETRVRLEDARWTAWYTMAVWASGSGTIRRHSVDGQDDDDARVATDTLEVRAGRVGRALQHRVSLFTVDPDASPAVRSVAVATSRSARERDGRRLPGTGSGTAWGSELAVPERSQRVGTDAVGGWCSPTSTSMVLGWWGHDVSVRAAAEATHDEVYGGTGNWAFNTAWAATFGLEAFVTRLVSLVDVERWVAAGVPVILSLAFGPQDLPGAPIDSTDGHLIVVRGFDASGDVIVNDPAGRSDEDVRRVYPRRALEALWLRSSGGTAYLIHPPGLAIPDRGSGSW